MVESKKKFLKIYGCGQGVAASRAFRRDAVFLDADLALVLQRLGHRLACLCVVLLDGLRERALVDLGDDDGGVGVLTHRVGVAQLRRGDERVVACPRRRMCSHRARASGRCAAPWCLVCRHTTAHEPVALRPRQAVEADPQPPDAAEAASYCSARTNIAIDTAPDVFDNVANCPRGAAEAKPSFEGTATAILRLPSNFSATARIA